MWSASDVSAQVAGYGPLLVASAGFITAVVAGASRRDKAQEGRAARLDAAADTALSGLQAAYDRTEAERARWQQAATTERQLREAAEQRAEAAEQRAEGAEAALARRRPDPPAPTSRRPTGR